MKFTTYSGSTYEVDLANKKARRLNGKHDPMPRQGIDGKWKKYINIIGPEVGSSCVFVWNVDVDSNLPIAQTTMTSEVMNIFE